MENNTTHKVIKTVMHNGIEIRRSNECKNRQGKPVYQWIFEIDGFIRPLGNNLDFVIREIDKMVDAMPTSVQYDFHGNYTKRAIVDGKFVIVSASRDEFNEVMGYGK